MAYFKKKCLAIGISPNSSFLRAKRFKLSECLCLNDVSPLFLFDRACWQHRYPYALVLAYVMPKRLLFHCSEPSSVQGRVQKYLAQVPNSFQEMSTVVVDSRMIVIDHDAERGDVGTSAIYFSGSKVFNAFF